MIRYYMGRHMIKKMSKTDCLGKALYMILQNGYVGNKKLGYRDVRKGELIIAPSRLCWKNKK